MVPVLLNSPVRSPNRGRSSTVSSVSSIGDAAPRMSRSRSRRASTIFSNLVGRDSGRGTPVEKMSMEQEEEESIPLPARVDDETPGEHFNKLREEGLSKYIRKLVDSRYLCF